MTAPQHKRHHTPAAPTTAQVHDFSLDDRYTRGEGAIYLSGIQALVRMVRDRALLDRRDGRATASFISGYEGSPLAGYDLELARSTRYLRDLDVVHRPALNEELAATSVMGSQVAAQLGPLRDSAAGNRTGIVGYWYGKAPGLDRASDAIRHANLIGTHPGGGAVALVGDDPGAKSSTVPCASELTLADLYLPTLYPADPQDILDFGVHAAILSRVSGLWTALKVTAAVADGSASAQVDPNRIVPRYGDLGPSLHRPSGMLLGGSLMELEQNQLTQRIPRALEYARLNGLNKIAVASGDDRIGIVAAGKTYLDVREALLLMGIDDEELHRRGIRILKLGMVYPIERDILHAFIDGLDEVIVVEEKRDFIETMMRDILFRHPGAPRIVGKAHEDGSTLFSRFGELDVDSVTRGLAGRLSRVHRIPGASAWLDRQAAKRVRIELPLATRSPYFCSGCPHSSSTHVGPDTLVGAGIGCHAMVLLMDEDRVGNVAGVTQMGGEGAQWAGMAPFMATEHFLQNLGDGTFAHSGSLAIRQAVAAGDNITYKILRNGTVAMTGGQDPVGGTGLGELVTLLRAEGVGRIAITSDDAPAARAALRQSGFGKLPDGVTLDDRHRLEDRQSELATTAGVTVLIHDQACAAEKRRDRRRGRAPLGPTRPMINPRICEGCGDCGAKSNCLSVHPVDTEFGRKTHIDQSSCNVDLRCLDGDCPAFVTVTPTDPGARVARPRAPLIESNEVPSPTQNPLSDDGFAVRIMGVGGTGVVTTSQILATAAVMDGNTARTVDMTGLAQKGGAVVSDVKIVPHPSSGGTVHEHAAKVATGQCDLYLVCDALVGVDGANLKVADPARTTAVVSITKVPTGAMVTDPGATYPPLPQIRQRIDSAARQAHYADVNELVLGLLGDEQYANMFTLGMAYQTGTLPITASAIERSIELNGVAVEGNLQAFRRGRQYLVDPAGTLRAAGLGPSPAPEPSAEAAKLMASLPIEDGAVRAALALRIDDLIGYQDLRYARGFRDDLLRIGRAATDGGYPAADRDALIGAAADGLHHLLAYKDEYEVARLTADAAFANEIAAEFGADAAVQVRLHPPVLRALGMDRKIGLGRWATPGLTGLAALKRLRGTRLDPFGRTEVRRTERALIIEYRAALDSVAAALRGPAHPSVERVTAVLTLPDIVRGYEDIKLGNVERYRAELAGALADLG